MNKDISTHNMQEETFVEHRRVCHGIISGGYELHELPITKEMLALCKKNLDRSTMNTWLFKTNDVVS